MVPEARATTIAKLRRGPNRQVSGNPTFRTAISSGVPLRGSLGPYIGVLFLSIFGVASFPHSPSCLKGVSAGFAFTHSGMTDKESNDLTGMALPALSRLVDTQAIGAEGTFFAGRSHRRSNPEAGGTT